VDAPGAKQTELRLGLLSVPREHPESNRVRLLTTILAGGVSSRLNRRLREELGYTYQVQSLFRARARQGLFVVGASLRTDRLATAVEVITEELRRLQDERVPVQELEAAQGRATGILLRSFQTSYDLAAQIVKAAASRYSAAYFRNYIESIYDVTPEALQEIARKHLCIENSIVVAVGPAREVRWQVPSHEQAIEVDAARVLDSDKDLYERRSAREN
jgi:predicted Zn-dependent peptidase